VEAGVTKEVVLSYRGNLIRTKHYLLSLEPNLYKKDKQVVLLVYSKAQVFALYGCLDSPGWLSWRVRPLDEESARIVKNMGRKFIDLTDPSQEDINWLIQNTIKKS
jgi:hypothetical protein